MFVSVQARFPAIRRAPAPRATRRSAHALRVVAFQESSAPPAAAPIVKFTVPMEVPFGQSLCLVGSEEALGGWEVAQALQMEWTEGHVWTATAALPPGTTAEFKLVISIPGEAPVWEHTANRTIAIPEGASALSLDLGAWCDPSAAAEPVAVAAPVAEEVDTELLTPPSFQAAVDSVKTFFSGGAAEAAEVDAAEDSEEALAAVDALAEAETASIDDEVAEEVIAAEEDAEEADEADVEVVAAEAANPTADALKSAAKTAGALALGVAGAALLSALAIDVTETAVVGALAVAAGGAALSGATPTKSSKTVTEDGEEDDVEGSEEGIEEAGEAPVSDERRIKGAGETGVIIAAGVLSALDAGKKAAELLGAKSTPSDE